jgi:hypothetical protein
MTIFGGGEAGVLFAGGIAGKLKGQPFIANRIFRMEIAMLVVTFVTISKIWFLLL